MSEMIERVAKAICAQIGDVDWHDSIYLAKASIEAMREPDNAMLHAAAKAMSPGRRPTPDRVSCKQKHTIRYQAMIVAALQSDNQER